VIFETEAAGPEIKACNVSKVSLKYRPKTRSLGCWHWLRHGLEMLSQKHLAQRTFSDNAKKTALQESAFISRRIRPQRTLFETGVLIVTN
jgi:hypothetical protein